MQDVVWIITVVLVAAIAVVFAAVVWRAGAPAHAGAAANPYRYRAPLFWLLLVVGVGATYGTLAEWPHGPGADKAAPTTVTVTGSPWSWELSPTRVPAGKPVVFAVTATDVNHGIGIYDADLTMLTQVQAMPGYVNKVHYTFAKPGQYKLLCLEYCGVAHHAMIAELTVE
jgi:cytochrome c oxidase subunit 2